MTGLHSTVTVLLESGAPVPHALIEALRGFGRELVRCTSAETALVMVQALQPAMVMVTSDGEAGEAETFLRVLRARRAGSRPALVRVGACARSGDGGTPELADAFVGGAADIAPLLARLDLLTDVGNVSDGLAGGGLPEIAYRVQRPDGLVRELLERCEWVPSGDAAAGRLVGTVLDVTDLRATQHRTDQMVALLTEAQQVASMGAWELDLATRRLIWSHETSALFGIAPEAFGGDEDAFLRFVLPQDQQRVIDAQRQADGRVDIEYRIRRPDGQVRWIQQRDQPLTLQGLPGRRMGVVMDVTERRSAEQMTRCEAQVLEAVLGAGDLHPVLNLLVQGLEEIMPGVLASIMLLDDDGRHLRRGASPNLPPVYMEAIDGLAVGPAQGSCGTAAYRKAQVIVSDIANDPLWAGWQVLAHAHGLGACWSNPVLGQDGRLLGTLALYRRQAVAPGALELQLMARAVRVAAIAIERALDALALRASKDLMRQTLEGAATGIAVTTLDYRFLDANAAYCRMIGYSVDELRQRDASELTHADDLPEMARLTGELLRGERTSYVVERRNLTKSGQIVWVRRTVSVRRDAQGAAIGLIGVAEDITREKSAEAALARSQSLLRVALRVGRMGAWAMTLPDRSLTWSDEACAIFGELPGYRATAEQVLAFFRPSHVEQVRKAFRSCIEDGVDFELESPITTRLGRTIWVRCIAEAVLGSRDEVVQVHGAIQDIDVHKRAEQQIRDSEQRFRLLAEATQDAIWEWNLETDAVWWSAGMYRLYGFDPAEPMDSWRWSRGEASTTWLDHVHPAERDDANAALRAFACGHSDRWSHEYRLRLPDGNYATVIDRGFAVRDAQGAMQRIVGGISDMTLTRRLEEQLRQAQRLEAVGQLSGGLAHDFNNLLTVIMGNAEMLADEMPQGDGKGDLVRMIGDAAQRGAELTQRMLAFARRQPLTPQSVDINAVVAGMDKLLRRTLGEHIEVTFSYAAGLRQALVDPAQFENALLNLCLNARDAMGQGGRLTVATRDTEIDSHSADLHGELAPGPYVSVVVSDTGHGIEPRHLGRVVEPFFTTKEKGNGTGLGLGLSMVYGFLKQSRGNLDISSQSGHGTTVTMYLPCAQRTALEQAAAPAKVLTPASASGTILLVEDNALVRRYASSQLASLGYTVREAVDGPSALRAIVQDVELEIDLLFTDVVMPGGMNGPALADAAHELRPQLPVLFTSGYTENTMVRDGRLGAGMQFLGKPYRRAELARRVAELMALAERSRGMLQDFGDRTGSAVAGLTPTGDHAA